MTVFVCWLHLKKHLRKSKLAVYNLWKSLVGVTEGLLPAFSPLLALIVLLSLFAVAWARINKASKVRKAFNEYENNAWRWCSRWKSVNLNGKLKKSAALTPVTFASLIALEKPQWFTGQAAPFSQDLELIFLFGKSKKINRPQELYMVTDLYSQEDYGGWLK